MQPAVGGYVYSELPVIGNKKETEEEKTRNEEIDAKSNLDIAIISLRENVPERVHLTGRGPKRSDTNV